MKSTILKIDRQGIEFPMIPCEVVKVLENGYYELVCSASILVNKYRGEDLMAFSGKLVEPTKLDKITQNNAISFNKGKKNAKIKTKRKEIVSVTEVSMKKDSCAFKLKNFRNGNCNCKKMVIIVVPIALAMKKIWKLSEICKMV